MFCDEKANIAQKQCGGNECSLRLISFLAGGLENKLSYVQSRKIESNSYYLLLHVLVLVSRLVVSSL